MMHVMHLVSLVMELNRNKHILIVVVVILAKQLVNILVKVVILDVILDKIVKVTLVALFSGKCRLPF